MAICISFRICGKKDEEGADATCLQFGDPQPRRIVELVGDGKGFLKPSNCFGAFGTRCGPRLGLGF